MKPPQPQEEDHGYGEPSRWNEFERTMVSIYIYIDQKSFLYTFNFSHIFTGHSMSLDPCILQFSDTVAEERLPGSILTIKESTIYIYIDSTVF